MPLYDYVCTSCGRSVEVMHGVHASGPDRCAECGGVVRKAMSLPAIVFKGSGWAKKDARGAQRSSATKDGKEGKEGDAGDAGDAGNAGKERKESKDGKEGKEGGADRGAKPESAKGGREPAKERTAPPSD